VHIKKKTRRIINMDKLDIHTVLRKHRIYQWEVARELGIADYTLSRWLRKDLSEEQVKSILEAINRIREERTY
jgi:uncharacterized metal-binding protein